MGEGVEREKHEATEDVLGSVCLTKDRFVSVAFVTWAFGLEQTRRGQDPDAGEMDEEEGWMERGAGNKTNKGWKNSQEMTQNTNGHTFFFSLFHLSACSASFIFPNDNPPDRGRGQPYSVKTLQVAGCLVSWTGSLCVHLQPSFPRC